jgi:hypothetical protein
MVTPLANSTTTDSNVGIGGGDTYNMSCITEA